MLKKTPRSYRNPRLEKARDILYAQGDRTLDMSNWYFCAWGHIHRHFVDEGIIFKGYPIYKGQTSFEALAIFFSIRREDALRLFGGPGIKTATEVAEQIDRFIERQSSSSFTSKMRRLVSAG